MADISTTDQCQAVRDCAISLPVVGNRPTTVRKSRNSIWRAGALITVHLAIMAHLIHWLVAKKTLSPLEPSEAMYTLNEGHLNAGFLLFALAILVTALLGRFFCGWTCHLVAYQDLCAWLLKKIGVKVKPFRSRILLLAPLALAIYMFVWPSFYRWWFKLPAPALINDLLTTDMWRTFPGLVMAILSVVVCGFGIVYFLGAKGFCTYGCPYGGFFALVEPIAVGRIRVTEDCHHCGHCTAVCTSNVRVHEEVAKFGMVVDPGCMKCLDCVSVCPNDALYWGLGRPSLRAKPSAPVKPAAFDFTWREEFATAVLGIALLLAYRGLYGQVALLMAIAMAAITAFLTIKLVHVFRRPNVRLQQLTLKHGSRLTKTGWVFTVGMVLWLGFSAHGGAVQLEGQRGQSLYRGLALPDEVWSPGYDWWGQATDDDRQRVERAIFHLERANRWGIIPTVHFLDDLVRLRFARGDADLAEQAAREILWLDRSNAYSSQLVGSVLRRAGRNVEAEQAYRNALRLNDAFAPARSELCGLLVTLGRYDDAVGLFAEHIKLPRDLTWALEFADMLNKARAFPQATRALESILDAVPESARAHWLLGVALAESGRSDDALRELRRANEIDPEIAEAQYDLALVLLEESQVMRELGAPLATEAAEHLQRAVALNPAFADAHYNLAVARMMVGKIADAVPSVREAIRLNPADSQYYAFLAHLLAASGDEAGAREAIEQAERAQRGR